MTTVNSLCPDKHCPICGYVSSTFFLCKNGYTITNCTQCGVLYVNPMPSSETLLAHYQNPAYFNGEEEQGYRHYEDTKKALLPHFIRRIHAINRQFPSCGKLLDFGCAAGYFLEVARANDWQIAGVELAQEMAKRASQTLKVPIATSLDILHDRDFDVLTMWEVLEHLPQPVAELARLCDRLRPGGMLMLSTPNAGHWQAVREPDKWIGYRPPSHLVYYTQRTLEDTLQRAGYKRIKVYKVSPLPPMPSWLSLATAPLQHSLANGLAKPWGLMLFIWRSIRVLTWAWQKIVYPHDDIFATLEAIGFRPDE